MKSKLIIFILPILLITGLFGPIDQNDEILWDKWGIPHIYASSDDNLYFMMGWAQMNNHGNLILKLYGEARAKSGEYWGKDIERDKKLHQLGVLDASIRSYALLPKKEREVMIAFAKGINAYAEKHSSEIENKFKIVLPVKPEDVMHHAFRVFYLEFLINRNLKTTNNWSPGSNAWAVNGRKTASGNTMLLANPHLPWNDFWLFFEAHFITKANNLYGATLVGLPAIGIGFNENLGWTHTVNSLDNVDFYELSVRNDQYKLDNEFHDFTIDSLRITEKTENGNRDIVVVRKQSEFGMVVKEGENKAIAIKWPNSDGKLNIIGQWIAMGKARSLSQFLDALKMNGLPLFNVIYSDKENNIMYHFGGNIPKKNGDWKKWQGIVPGKSSKDLWQGYYSVEEVPAYINPRTGWIQNANDPPYTSTLPSAIDPKDYPSHIAPNSMSFRPQRSARLIKETKNLTLADFIELKHDTKSEFALKIKEEIKTLNSTFEDSLTRVALKILNKWDGSFDATSIGPVLFSMFVKELGSFGVFETDWSFNDPLNTPKGLKNETEVLASLKNAAENHLAKYGTLNIAYGKVYQLKVGNFTYDGNGGAGPLGIFRTVDFTSADDGKYYANHGETYVCVMEFGDEVEAEALLTYGNATQAQSPHVGDQLKLFAEKKLRKVWLKREEQLKNLEKAEKLGDMQH